MADDTISVGHPFYFPTQVILLDDDPDFLEGVSLMLNKCLSFKLFQSAQQALDYVNNAHRHVKILERCYSNYKTGPLESDSLSHIDIDKLHLEVLNEKFNISMILIYYRLIKLKCRLLVLHFNLIDFLEPSG